MNEQRTFIAGHRGAPDRAPENTIRSFELALEAGADALEVDVRLCGDGTPVCLHDPTLDRVATSDVSGLPPVSRMTWDQLRRVGVGRHRSSPAMAVEDRIPTLDEVVARFRGRTRLLLDLKRDPGAPSPIGAVARVLDRVPAEIWLMSFCRPTLLVAASLAPRARRIVLADVIRAEETLLRAAWAAGMAHGICLPSAASSSDLALACRGLGIGLLVYGAGRRSELEACFELGVEGVITDHVNLATEARDGCSRAVHPSVSEPPFPVASLRPSVA